MNLFQKLLVAPAALGLLTPLTVSASEVNLDAISNYSNNNLEIDVNSFTEDFKNELLLAGGEGLVDSDETVDIIGGFSETTTASFGVEFLVGSLDGGDTGISEATTFDYSMGIGLETSFTGEDSLAVTFDIGSTGDEDDSSVLASADLFNYNATEDGVVLDGLTYTFPVGGATVMVGDNTDISALYTGACAYSSFTDYAGNCGTGNSVGLGGNGATAAMSYAFDSGFSLAGGISSVPTEILSEAGDDAYGIEAAYTADSWGVAVAYSDIESTDDDGEQADTTFWGINGMYAFDFATISAGVESENPDGGDTATGFFVGLSFPEVGEGSLDLSVGTTGNFADGDEEYYAYEASYAYPVNDGMTITPGVAYAETEDGDITVFAVKTSFSF